MIAKMELNQKHKTTIPMTNTDRLSLPPFGKIRMYVAMMENFVKLMALE
jgi:hypothetical protein